MRRVRIAQFATSSQLVEAATPPRTSLLPILVLLLVRASSLPLLTPRRLVGSAETALFASAELFVRVQPSEQNLTSRHNLRWVLGSLDLQRSELLHKSLNLRQIVEDGLRRIGIIHLQSSSEM